MCYGKSMGKNNKLRVKANVLIPANMDSQPERHEIEVAWIIAEYFNCEVKFLKPVDSYKRKTPDIEVNRIQWEIKSPIGNSRKTIANQLRRASAQSKYIIFDCRRTKIADVIIENRICNELLNHRSINKVLLVKKNKIVVDLSPVR
jgi:hypothetical protein